MLDIKDPKEARKVIRSNKYSEQTAGTADKYVQGNVCILPSKYAEDFSSFCKKNPKPCPLIGLGKKGDPSLPNLGNIDIRTVAGAVDALKVIDRALDRVHMERAKFGAVMSRMNVVIDNLTNVSTNQKTSMSRITDANFAAESARLAKSQILQQSGMNMISEASRTMQNVLILFQ